MRRTARTRPGGTARGAPGVAAATAVVLLSTFAIPGVGAAGQDRGATGRWSATWANAVRSERDGGITVQKTAAAELRLEQDGDSLRGTWSFELPGTGPRTWRVRGTFDGSRLVLVATETESGGLPGDAGARLVRQEWTATLRDGRLEGEHWMILETPDRTVRSGPRPWSARRPWSAPRSPRPVPRYPRI